MLHRLRPIGRPVRIGLTATGCALVALLGMTTPALAQHSSAPSTPHSTAVPVPDPTLAGPVVTRPDLDGTHGIPYTSSAVDLASHGYSEQEYFVSGTARAYQPVGTLTADGRWNVQVASTAAYKTRIIVRKPINLKTFSGNVVVEWMNATVGRDLGVGWVFGSNGLLHDNDIYVGVSAQALPISGPAQSLQAWDPARYGSLVHPGDQYSYDIFAQVAQALRHPRGVNPISGAKIRSVIAYGDSQSAFRLVTYADALQNRDQVFDGILLNSRFGNGAALNTGATPPTGTVIRPDVKAKVLTLETETDIIRGSNGFLPATQPNSNNFRLWEVAGSSHFNAAEEATMRIQAFRESPFANPPLQFNSCPEAMNNLSFGDVVDAAFHDLAHWTVDNGYRPPSPGLVGVTPDGTAYVKNSLGLTVGGIQLPQVAVPTGVVSGLGNTGTGTCTLAGEYVPFSQAQLTSLYPNHQVYVSKFDAATARSVAQGFIEPYDADVLRAQAAGSAIPAMTNVP
ncbi:MAG TPA: alpha/beta hydrolase domain-containing protein [Pseudonocardiaceae bacterium]|nr:alpha/beta hydrolase domain-containing protein [Pseudonocardiaceae bacterium]